MLVLATAVYAQNEEALTRTALDYYTKGNYSEAINYCNKALGLNSSYAWAYTIRGLSYYSTNQARQAVADYTNAIAYSTNYKDAYYYRGNAYYVLGEYVNAITDYTKTIEIDPAYKWAYHSRGLAYNYLKDDAQAISNFTSALRTDPAYIDSYYWRGNIYFRSGNYASAIADYSQAITLDPKYKWAYYGRATGNYYLGQYEKAKDDYEMALMLDPKYTDSYVGRGLCYRQLAAYQKATDDFSKAIETDPSHINALLNRGDLYSALGMYEKALADFTKIILISPQYADAYNNRGIAYTLWGKYSESADDFKKAIELNPQHAQACINILIPLIQNNQFAEAGAYYSLYSSKQLKAYIEYDRWKFLKTYISACVTELPQKNYQKAKQLLQESLKQYSDYINTREEEKEGMKIYVGFVFSKLGYTCQQQFQQEEALNYYNKALAINNNIADASLGIAQIKAQRNTITQADKIPPHLILLPGDTIYAEAGAVRTSLMGRVTDEGGIAWVKVDGRPVSNIEEDGTFVALINLQAGKQNAVIEVADKAGNTSNRLCVISGSRGGETKTRDFIKPITSKDQKYYALLIAAEKYQDDKIPDLTRPLADAKAIKEVLLKNYTFEEKNISIIADKSREDILGAISTTIEKMTADDNLLIFFAGHGTYKTGINKDDIEGYLMPVTASQGKYYTYISASDLITAMKGCKARHILFIADACYSGSMVRRSLLPSDAPVPIETQYSYKSRQLMASGNLEPVPDKSVFIHYFTQRLGENRDKYVTASDLFGRFRDATINNTSGKTLPICEKILDVGDEGGQFVFIKK
ncbi:MAG: tetratricopeptide repeat protein [Chitinophagaceae bacterium]|nr:tetratricopeptide repeat protein [Chitinophagaceae bacterium]